MVADKRVDIGDREGQVVEFVPPPVRTVAAPRRIPVQFETLRPVRGLEDRDFAARFTNFHSPRHPHPQDRRVEGDRPIEVPHPNSCVPESHDSRHRQNGVATNERSPAARGLG